MIIKPLVIVLRRPNWPLRKGKSVRQRLRLWIPRFKILLVIMIKILINLRHWRNIKNSCLEFLRRRVQSGLKRFWELGIKNCRRLRKNGLMIWNYIKITLMKKILARFLVILMLKEKQKVNTVQALLDKDKLKKLRDIKKPKTLLIKS